MKANTPPPIAVQPQEDSLFATALSGGICRAREKYLRSGSVVIVIDLGDAGSESRRGCLSRWEN